MSAPVGNKFWLMRSSHGRNPIFAKPEDLMDAAQQYFAWVEENPLWEDSVKVAGGEVVHVPLAHVRAMTIGGLCIFLGISRQAWSEYEKRQGYGEVTKAIAEVIRDQKFAGAAADLLNANIIARDLGLADKTEHSGTVTFTDLADRVKRAKGRK